MHMYRNLISVLLAAALFSTSVFAHHSTRGIYREEMVELTGTVKEWRFINPHPYLTIEAEDANGILRDWDVSYGGAAVVHLQRRGYTADTFTPGEIITVHGNPARAEGVYGLLVEGGEDPTREDGTPVVVGGSMF